MKTAIVTGANGFVGRALTRELLKRGSRVYAIGFHFDKDDEISASENYVPIELEFQHYIRMKEYLPECEIDVFYHLAWGGGFERNTLKNYRLQLENAKAAGDAMIGAIQMNAKRFVYAGTINETETQQFIDHFETFRTRPTCIYAAAKLTAELICRTLAQEDQMHYCAGLIPMIYGEGNRSKQLINVVVDELIHGREPKLISGNNMYDLVHVDDVARAFVEIGNKGIDGKRYYVGHRKLKTFQQWMQEVRDIVSPQTGLHFGEYNDPLNLDYSLLGLDELYRDTGFECRENLSEQMRKYVEWFIKDRQLETKGS